MVQSVTEGTAVPALLERDRELAAITAAINAAADGHGGVVWVEGPAGIGKTSLLRAAGQYAHEAGLRVLRARPAALARGGGGGGPAPPRGSGSAPSAWFAGSSSAR